MDVQIQCQPSYSIAYCYLDYQESVFVENDAMAVMSGGVDVSVGTGGGNVAKAAARKLFGGENFFFGKYTADVHGAWVAVTPAMPGDVTAVCVEETGGLHITTGCLLAMESEVDVDVKVAGVRSVVAREGFTMLHARGTGKVLIATYGAIQRFELEDGQDLIVDTGHLVARTPGVQMRVGPLSGVTTAAVTGEGFVAHMQGPGSVFVQTRAEKQLQSWLLPDRLHND